jgi:predicted GNAT superfamily acetyltransferase
MVEIRESTVDEMLAHAGELFAEHWDEIALNKQVMVLKPDEARYRGMEASGGLLILAAFVDGELVGYSVNFVIHHLHYADLCVCSNDLLFIAQSHREGGLGIRLMRRTEEAARARGARLVLWHAKPNTALAAILPRMGYGVQDIIFSKEV